VNWIEDLRRYRQLHRLTQAQLAELLDVDPTTVGRWERGRDKPNLAVQGKLQKLIMPKSDALVRSIRDIVMMTSDIAVVMDKEFRIIAASAAHQALLRYNLADIRDTPFPMWTEAMFTIMDEVGGPQGWWSNDIYRLEFTAVRRPKEEAQNQCTIYQNVSTVTIRDSDGAPLRFSITKTVDQALFVAKPPKFTAF
jgi:DNA-binding XRE family transcriptional regulator